MSVICVSICTCGFPVRLRVERRKVGWAGEHEYMRLCVCVCMWRAGVAACMPVCETCLLR